MPASALGHGAFPFWDASFVHQYWASAELYQAQLCRDFFSFFFFYLFFWCTCLFAFSKIKMISLSSRGQSFGCMDSLPSWPCCQSRVLLAALLTSAALEGAPHCPVVWCLQGDKAFLSACPSLLPSGDFVEPRTCCGAVCIWGADQSPSEQGGRRGAQHVKFPLTSKSRGQNPPQARWIN